jgi:multidrug efflux pump subunit AcrA (membrane-fusion protein)
MTIRPPMKTVVMAITCAAGAGLAAPDWGKAFAAPQTATTGAVVLVVRASNACFSDMVRVTGFLVARKMAEVNVDSEGFRVVEVLAAEGDQVTSGQELARLSRAGGDASAGAGRTAVSLRAPAAGVVTRSTARVGAMASLQAEPLFRIMVDNEVELEVEVPSLHLPKLKSGETARVTIDDGVERSGRVRLVSPEIDQRTQLGRARLTVGNDPALRLGLFARATIDASRSCGIAVPRAAVDYQTEGTSVQVVHEGTVETRRVRVGLLSDDNVEIRTGLKEGETVVANAGTSLHDGEKVRPVFVSEFDQPRVP